MDFSWHGNRFTSIEWPFSKYFNSAVSWVPTTSIAFDSAGTAAQNIGASGVLTIAHTCTGSDRILFVGAHGIWGATGWTTSVKYNWVSLTQIDTVSPQSNTRFSLWYMVAPATWTNNIVITITGGSGGIIGVQWASASYTGVRQTGIPDSKNKGTATNSSLTVATTVVAANSWVVACGLSNSSSVSASTGVTSRSELDSVNGSPILWDSNWPQGAGSYSSRITGGAVDAMGLICASFADVGSP